MNLVRCMVLAGATTVGWIAAAQADAAVDPIQLKVRRHLEENRAKLRDYTLEMQGAVRIEARGGWSMDLPSVVYQVEWRDDQDCLFDIQFEDGKNPDPERCLSTGTSSNEPLDIPGLVLARIADDVAPVETAGGEGSYRMRFLPREPSPDAAYLDQCRDSLEADVEADGSTGRLVHGHVRIVGAGCFVRAKGTTPILAPGSELDVRYGWHGSVNVVSVAEASLLSFGRLVEMQRYLGREWRFGQRRLFPVAKISVRLRAARERQRLVVNPAEGTADAR